MVSLAEMETVRAGTVALLLQQLDFQFDPFAALDAAADPYLEKYIVGLHTFAVAWDDVPTLIFAPAGGGKTAMRIYTARICWTNLGAHHPFPIVYVPADHAVGLEPPSPAHHLACLIRSGALTVFQSLLARPARFLALDRGTRCTLVSLLDAALPASLSYYLNVLRETANPAELASLGGLSLFVSTPSLEEIRSLAAAMEATPLSSTLATEAEPVVFEVLTNVILQALDFRSIFLLLDGVDAFYSTAAHPSAAAVWVDSLMDFGDRWAQKHIFIKGFLPLEIWPELMPHLNTIRWTRIEWQPSLLAEMLRRRVYVASGGKFGSLDAISSPALRDVETRLTSAITPLPREALVVVKYLLEACAHRRGGGIARLEADDLEVALRRYAADPVTRRWRTSDGVQ